MLNIILTSLYYLVATSLWYVIYLAGRAIVRRFRLKRYLAGLAFSGLTTFLVWGGLELGMLPGSKLYRNCYYAHQWFGKIVLIGTPRFSYDSEREFNGDGYSIDVFDISNSFAAWATTPPADFMISYPQTPGFRSHWKSTTWHKTPISAKELKFLDFAMNSYYTSDTSHPKLDAAISLLEKLAKEPGSYIAILYSGSGDSVGDVDFFLLSPLAKTFILVNHNT